jgi:hypothetical protein
MKLSLASAGVLLLTAFGLTGCSGSSSPSYSVGDDSGSTSGGDDSGSSSKGDGGGGNTGDGGGGSCTIPADWAQNSAGPLCDTCMQAHCCPVIQASNSDPGCKAIYDCQTNCYSGTGPDGGALSDDGGPVDDAGDTTGDLCAQSCVDTASSAAQALFTPQDDCVNGSSGTQCGGASVCN